MPFFKILIPLTGKGKGFSKFNTCPLAMHTQSPVISSLVNHIRHAFFSGKNMFSSVHPASKSFIHLFWASALFVSRLQQIRNTVRVVGIHPKQEASASNVTMHTCIHTLPHNRGQFRVANPQHWTRDPMLANQLACFYTPENICTSQQVSRFVFLTLE